MIQNLLNEKNTFQPNYDLSNSDMRFKVYLNYDRNICIEYIYDENYTAGVYISTIDDYEEIKEIFTHCFQNKPTLVGNLSSTLNTKEWKSIIKEGMKIYIKKEYYEFKKKMIYIASGSNTFTGENAKFTTKEIQRIYQHSLNKAEFLTENKHYYKTLLHLHKILKTPHTDPVEHYEYCEPIRDILFDQQYMRLCQDEKVRKLFCDVNNTMSSIYQNYMRSII